jgi:prepilin signal peptidase PulO-like enzyme (type II secretory pathway)
VYRFFEIWNFNIGHLLEIARPASLVEAGGNWKLEIFWPFSVYCLAALIPSLFFAALIIITKGKGLGWGDAKLVFLMGLMLGWPGILLALLLAFGTGSLVGLSLVALGRKTMRSPIPFGPFLAAGALITLFWGPAILGGYFHLL